MLRNYLRTAFRALRQQKVYAAINVLGLSIGIACCILIGLYVADEWSYDRFYPKSDRIVRFTARSPAGLSARSPVPLGPTLESSLPEAQNVVRFWRAFQPVVGRGTDYYQEHGRVYFADPGALSMFDLPLRRGNPASALQQPGSTVLTPDAAKKYFGDVDPIGKTLEYDGYPAGERSLTVTGVLEPLPGKTHLDFEVLVSLNGVTTESSNWGSWKPIWTYALLTPGANPSQLEAKLPDFFRRHAEYEDVPTPHLEPITDIHLYSEASGGFAPGGSVTYLYLFAGVGLFVLVLAIINFINLATARSVRRAGEVGIRKALGAHRAQLTRQFLGEAFLQCGGAVLIGLGLARIGLPVLNALANKTIAAGTLLQPATIGALVCFGIAVGIAAGTYPAFVLSRYEPSAALRGRVDSDGSVSLRRGLVVTQFTVSCVLLIAAAGIFQQLQYIRHKDLGIDAENVAVVPAGETPETLVKELERTGAVLEASVSSRVPVNMEATDGRPVTPQGHTEAIQVQNYFVDASFVEMYDIQIVAGRNLREDRETDDASFLINEAAVARFGWASPKEALGKRLLWGANQKSGRIVGVVENFHLGSLHQPIEPLVLHRSLGWGMNYVSVRFKTEAFSDVKDTLKEIWTTVNSEGAYRYFFVEQNLEQLHRADRRFGRVIGLFAGLALFIACLGLFGLAAYSATQRRKEIGVRKALGATATQIMGLLSKEAVVLVTVAFTLAVPLAYVALQRWLQTFAYHVTLGPGLFLLAGVTVLVVAVVAVSTQALRAARIDPAQTLRSE